jgi:putative SOS response-associated peptidase YedK
MCGRFEQCCSRQEYAEALGVDVRCTDRIGGNVILRYNISLGRGALILHTLRGRMRSDYLRWGYHAPQEAAEKKKPWIWHG